MCVSLQDIFAVAVSLITGKIVYISDQAAAILHCSKDEFKDRKFVEFLTPQDVSVFYSFTTPYRLPSWSMCTGAGEYTHTQASLSLIPTPLLSVYRLSSHYKLSLSVSFSFRVISYRFCSGEIFLLQNQVRHFVFSLSIVTRMKICLT